MEKRAATAHPIGAAFEPDVLVSYRYFKVFRARSHLSSEQRLMFAVLTDAIECFQKNVSARTCANHKLFSEAQAWITSPEGSWPFSFECICDTLGLDPNYIRAGLRRWRCNHKLRKRARKRMRESLRYQRHVSYNQSHDSAKRDAAQA